MINFEGIIHALAGWRQRGSTTSVAQAARNYGTLVVHDVEFAASVKKKHGNEHVLSLSQFADSRGGKAQGPVLIDHWVLCVVAQEGLHYKVAAKRAEGELKVLQAHLLTACVELSLKADHSEVANLKTFMDSWGLVKAIKEVVRSRNHYRDQRDRQATALQAIKDLLDATYNAEEERTVGIKKILEELHSKE